MDMFGHQFKRDHDSPPVSVFRALRTQTPLICRKCLCPSRNCLSTQGQALDKIFPEWSSQHQEIPRKLNEVSLLLCCPGSRVNRWACWVGPVPERVPCCPRCCGWPAPRGRCPSMAFRPAPSPFRRGERPSEWCLRYTGGAGCASQLLWKNKDSCNVWKLNKKKIDLSP